MSPLLISRTPTIVSLTQLAGEGPEQPQQLAAAPEGALRSLSAPDCPLHKVPGSLLPLYRFPARDGFASKRLRSFGSFEDLQDAAAVPDVDDAGLHGASGSDDEDTASLGGSSSSSGGAQLVPQRSVLDALLLAEWEDRAEQGLFRYDVTACPTKVVPGSYGFIAQCNEGRLSKKRPTEFRIDQVSQPFDDGKFNFKKALQKEALFMMEPSQRASAPAFLPAAPAGASPHLVLINVSPIEYGHVLLVPRALDNLPQLVTPDTLLLALQLAREADNPYFRLGFNSLGAYGTINHLHFQAYYLAAPFAMERAPTEALAPELLGGGGRFGGGLAGRGKGRRVGGGGAARGAPRVERLREYPVRTLVFEAGDSLGELAALVGGACQRLTAANVPHNLFIADCGARVFLFPNCFAERKARGLIPEDVLETQVDPACWEVAGHIVLKRDEDYEEVTQEAAWRLLSLASCSEERFREIAQLALKGQQL